MKCRTFIPLARPGLLSKMAAEASADCRIRRQIVMTPAGTYLPRLAGVLAPAPDVPCSWLPGASTVRGRVRRENQDAVRTEEVGPWQIALCADGLGGLPMGGDASRIAVSEAARWLRARLGRVIRTSLVELRGLALAGLHEAQRALERQAEFDELSPDGGLRTTLIVVVAGPDFWAYAHAGDGFGIRVLPSRSRVESWLKPQKGAAWNEVACSLGPCLEGIPRSGVLERDSDELLAFGSDGIGDQVDLESFGFDLLRRLQQDSPSLSATCAGLLEELASLPSGQGFIFEDNLSLVVLQSDPIRGVTC